MKLRTINYPEPKTVQKFLTIVLIISTISCTNDKGPFYRINGKIDGVSSGKVFLHCNEFKDTSSVENGEFTFSGSLKNPLLCEIEFEGYDHSRHFYIENSVIGFSGSIDSLEKADITGSKTEDERSTYQSLMSEFDRKYADLEKEYKDADAVREAQLDAIYEQVELSQVEVQKQFVKQNPTSFLCIKILIEIDWSFSSSSEFNDYVSLLDTSLNNYEGTLYLKELVKRMGNVELGETAPDFEMNDENGKSVRLSAIYPNSEFLLIDFWASTCGPCRKENATIRAAYDLYHQSGLEILGVSTDTKKELWLKAIEKDGLMWKNICSLEKWGENEVVAKYALRQVSQNFLLDKNGIIIAKDLRGEALISSLDELLKSD